LSIHIAVLVEGNTGNYASAIALGQLASDHAIAANNNFWLVQSLGVQAETSVFIGDLASAKVALFQAVALATGELYSIDIFGTAVTSFAFHIESLNISQAACEISTAAQLQSRSGNQNQANIVKMCQTILASEAGNDQLAPNSEKLCTGDLSVSGEYLALKVDFLRSKMAFAFSFNGQHAARNALTKLSPILRKSPNPLWHSWLCDTACRELLGRGDYEACSRLFNTSQHLVASVNAVPTPRQRKFWQECETGLIDYLNQNANNRSVNVVFSCTSAKDRAKLLDYIAAKLFIDTSLPNSDYSYASVNTIA
jgi:hypothetical protein